MEANNVTRLNDISRTIKRGDILWINFGKKNVIGSEQSKELRPAIVIQNDIGSQLPTTKVVGL